MIIEAPNPADDAADSAPLLADEPTPPGDNIAELIDEMEERVLHGEEEAAQEAKENTDAEDEAPAPEDVDASGGTPV
jgi:hypothetical protein